MREAGGPHLNLFQKSLILVGVPLLFEIALVAWLYATLQESQAEVRAEQRAKKIIVSVDRLIDGLQDASKSVMLFVLFKEKAGLTDYQQRADLVRKQFAELRQILAGDGKAVERVNTLEILAEEIRTTLDKGLEMGELNNRLGRHEAFQKLRPLIVEFISQGRMLQNSVRGVVTRGVARESRTRKHLHLALAVGLCSNVAIAIALALFFNRGITSRLAIMVDNTRKLARGEPLNAFVGGADEIAQLDDVFREMSGELNAAQEKLKENEARVRRVIETLPAGLVVVNGEGTIVLVNPALERMLEYERNQLSNKSLNELFNRPGSVEGADHNTLKLIESSRNRACQLEAFARSGVAVPIELTLTDFSGFGERGYLGMVVDVTERHRIERMKREFVSMISHDLRAPLTSIQLFIELLQNSMLAELSPLGRKKADAAERSAGRMLRLINDLVEIERLESGQVELVKRPFSVRTACDKAVESISVLAEHSNIRLEVDCDISVSISGDEEGIIRVLINLLANALKFSPPGSVVRLAAQKASNCVEMSVSDQGRGIPAHLLDEVFNRFKQVDHLDRTEKKGSGLGLAICRSIVEMHHGEIGVRSQIGEGSTFWIRLPVGDDARDPSGVSLDGDTART